MPMSGSSVVIAPGGTVMTPWTACSVCIVRATGILLGCGLNCNLGSKQMNMNVSGGRFRKPGPSQL
jgi:hypothetical protein